MNAHVKIEGAKPTKKHRLAMRASDADETKLRYPLLIMPKIDGVRSLNEAGDLIGRSLKQHGNRYTTWLFSNPVLDGFDGEMASDEITHPRLVNLTSSAIGKHEGEPRIEWWLFDYVTEETIDLPYAARLKALHKQVTDIKNDSALFAFHDLLHIVEFKIVHSHEELLAQEEIWLDMGFEGVITRDPLGKHKRGTSTAREGGYGRIKRFVIEEALVVGFTEEMANNNEKTVNEQGRSTRSSHKENLTPNAKIGNLLCINVKDGKDIVVGPGRMKHDERAAYFEDPTKIVNHVIKYKHFPKGVKDKPRFPTFEVIRAPSDIDPALMKLINDIRMERNLPVS